MIRQQPITTAKEFDDWLANHYKDKTLFIQWHPSYINEQWPEVELLENFLYIHTNPNDSWHYIENGEVRAWCLFPNLEEREMLWEKKDE